MKKLLKTLFLLIILVIVTAILFIKLNITAAANFTDDVLRPLIGDANVIFLEKVFFNVSDQIEQIASGVEQITPPLFNNDNLKTDDYQLSGLDLTAIPVTNNFSHLRNEGIWKVIKLKAFPNEGVMALTFVRPDKNRSFSVVTVAQLDMSKLILGVVAGTKKPGGEVGNPGPGKVPPEIVASDRLIAAFDGGFQYKDGAYGMIVDGKTYLPLQKDLGSVVGYKNGTFKIINYSGQDLGKDITYIRQNCPILIENGMLSVSDIRNKKLWGRTPTTDIYTWRTGMGQTKNGRLLFAVGNNLTPETLAIALKMAGAENAIQLDINPNWVRFNIFSPLGGGKYDSTTLTHDLKSGADTYLNGYSKDFFYLYKK